MATPSTFAASLRLRHPNMAASDISLALKLTPKHEWTSGEERINPLGQPLGGMRSETYWCYPVQLVNADLGDAVTQIIEIVAPARDFLIQFRASGGSAELFVGISVEANCGEMLPSEQLLELGRLGLDLALDFYAPDHSKES